MNYRQLFLTLLLGLGTLSLQAQRSLSHKQPQMGPANGNLPTGVTQVINGQPQASTLTRPMPALQLPTSPTRTHPTGFTHLIQASEGPTFVKTDAPRGLVDALRSPLPSPERAIEAIHYLRNAGLTAIPADFQFVKAERDDLGFVHVRLQQMAEGIPVYGADAWVHISPNDELIFNGRYQPEPDLSQQPLAIDQDQARGLAIAHLDTHTPVQELSSDWKYLLKYEEIPAELVVYRTQDYVREQRRAWHVTLRPNVLERHELFIDAATGYILNEFDHTCTVSATGSSADLNGVMRNISVWQVSPNQYQAIDVSRNMYVGNGVSYPQEGDGFVVTLDLQNTNLNSPSYTDITTNNPNNWAPKEVSAHFNAGESYDYFESVHSRNSINGEGGDVISFINVADDDGSGLDNAFWNGAMMFYGNGNQVFTAPTQAALDVAGHEMSHGVIQETANLVYQDQPGALNESFADVFGVMIDRDDWQLGEGIMNTNFFPTGALRDMSNPHNGGTALGDPSFQPDHMDELYTGSDDNGGVHINSGIPNHAFYLYATAIGKNQAERVYYRALTHYLTRSSEFIDCRLAVCQAAEDLFGANSNQVQQAKAAFSAVGIGEGPGNQGPIDLEPNPGSEYVLLADTYNFDNGESIYTADANGLPSNPGYFHLNFRVPNSKFSIQDNGDYTYFVGEDGYVYALGVDPNATDYGTEYQISNDDIWRNVAISKDGNRLAAVTQFIDTAIYVFDLENNTGVKYRLYIPTTAQDGSNAGGVLYADALAWSHDGDLLMYDAYNVFQSTTADTIDFWDISFIDVWDNATDDYGDGTIFKLFSNLDPGVNVGNATFSKNSPAVIAFDYFNTETGEVFIFGADIENNQVEIVTDNNDLGFPEYSVQDNRIIYNYYNSTDSEYDIYGINLQANKIQSNGTGSRLIPDAKWGVWFATGSRVLSSVKTQVEEANWQVYPVPTDGELTVQFEAEVGETVKVQLLDLTGRILQEKSPSVLSNDLQHSHLGLQALPTGIYVLKLQVGQQIYSKQIWRR